MAASSTSRQSVLHQFETCRSDLDEHNDRRERLIKASRDVTNLSKKVIFLLHRLVTEDTSDEAALAKYAAKCGQDKLHEVQAIYADLRHELYGDLFWRYERQVSPGLQEYIEALSFAHFLERSALITYDQVQQTLCDASGVPYFPLTVSDYLLGISDLTGELMRFAISGISRRGGRRKAGDVCAFVRGCKADLERLTPYVHDLSKKQAVTTQSLEKIEDAAYALAVRGSEYDLSPEAMDRLVAQSIAGVSKGQFKDDANNSEHDM
ncbi:Translin [Infundibulicybe gibba]|nr:Translin [Infundibulicybe gibba]